MATSEAQVFFSEMHDRSLKESISTTAYLDMKALRVQSWEVFRFKKSFEIYCSGTMLINELQDILLIVFKQNIWKNGSLLLETGISKTLTENSQAAQQVYGVSGSYNL